MSVFPPCTRERRHLLPHYHHAKVQEEETNGNKATLTNKPVCCRPADLTRKSGWQTTASRGLVHRHLQRRAVCAHGPPNQSVTEPSPLSASCSCPRVPLCAVPRARTQTRGFTQDAGHRCQGRCVSGTPSSGWEAAAWLPATHSHVLENDVNWYSFFFMCRCPPQKATVLP